MKDRHRNDTKICGQVKQFRLVKNQIVFLTKRCKKRKEKKCHPLIIYWLNILINILTN